jgi:hypothetical protein
VKHSKLDVTKHKGELLDQIMATKREEVAAQMALVPLSQVKAFARLAPPPLDFAAALTAKPGVALIAEVKRASPSRGLIARDWDPPLIAETYARAGAAAVSCLTDKRYFQGDLEYLTAIKRAATKFGAKIVEERAYAFDAGSRRTDTGHQQIQTQMPLLTQGAPDYDVVYVADVGEAFGDYLMFRTHDPRPVVGSQGLQAVAWHRSFEQYAGTQLQNRFEKQANRIMTERDYTAWLAVRVFGEAVTRISKNGIEDVRAYILSKDFEVAGFKGIGLTFRSWDHQMRQPILLSGPRTLVSISPQDGFLHQKFLTDTMGFDQPETKCRLEK